MIGVTQLLSKELTPVSFSPTVSYLVVGGGASGGGGSPGNDRAGGGGGAGGVLSSTAVFLGGAPYAIQVSPRSNGGAYTNASVQGPDGGDSIFSNITAYGGGGGGSAQVSGSLVSTNHGRPGASGGGAGGIVGAQGGAATQGYAGAGMGAGCCASSGGGGAGSGGTSSSGGNSNGNGGNGVVNNITGSDITYGIGGAGESGGTYDLATQGLNGRGNGGEGAGGDGNFSQSGKYNYQGAPGGSGIVILKYIGPSPTISAGLTYTISTVAGNNIISFTAGTGTITF